MARPSQGDEGLVAMASRKMSHGCKTALLTLGMLTAIALVLASSAGASTGTPVGSTSIFDAGTNRLTSTAMTQMDTTWTPSTYGATPSSWTTAEKSAFNIVEKARIAGRFSPGLRVLGTVGLAATALDLGWKIGTPGGSFIYKKLTGDDYGTTAVREDRQAGTLTWRTSAIQWNYYTSSDVVPSTTVKWPYTGWYLSFSRCNTAACTPSGTIYAIGTPSAGERTSMAGMVTMGGVIEWVDSGTTRIAIYCSESCFTDAAKIRPSTSTEYSACSSPCITRDSGVYSPPASPSTADRAAAGAVLAPTPGGATVPSPEQLGAQDELCHDTSGLTCEDGTGETATPVTTETTFTLPRPYNWETYNDYLERLRALGWLGTITFTDDTTLDGTATAGSDYEAMPVGGITGITVTGSSPVAIFNSAGARQPWPNPVPNVNQNDNITIKKKPDSTDLPPPPGSTGGGINFDPITSLDFGCKFPFGFICYAQDVTNQFDVTAQAPQFNFDIHSQTLGGHTYAVGTGYDVDLSVMDDYMTIWRTLVSFVLWIGAVYFVAVKLVGFKAGGDPGEALDDVSPLG